MLELVNKFVYLGSCISVGGGVSDEISSRISKARFAFINLRHLWRRKDISLATKGRVYSASVRSVLLYGCETWPIRAEDVRRLSVFDSRCLRTIARVWWDHHLSNDTVRRRVFKDSKRNIAVPNAISRHRFRWLGHVLRMPPHRLTRRALFSEPGIGWKLQRGGQAMTWHRSMKQLTSRLASVDATRLPGWGPKDSQHRWMETLSDMAQNRNQWRLCGEFIIS
jgi:Domain of unknown function (DUF6451)